MRAAATAQRGYSLLEVIVVLVLVAMVFAIFATSLTRGISNAELRSAGRDLVAGLRYTRGQAIVTGEESTLSVDADAKAWQAPDRDAVELPEAMGVKLLTARSELTGEAAGNIRFFPDGSSTGGKVTLTAEDREWIVAVSWLTGEVNLSRAEQ